jgi:hypothetical protein
MTCTSSNTNTNGSRTRPPPPAPAPPPAWPRVRVNGHDTVVRHGSGGSNALMYFEPNNNHNINNKTTKEENHSIRCRTIRQQQHQLLHHSHATKHHRGNYTTRGSHESEEPAIELSTHNAFLMNDRYGATYIIHHTCFYLIR